MVRLLTLTTLAVAGCMSPMTTSTSPNVERGPGSLGVKKPEATQGVGLLKAPAGVISTGGDAGGHRIRRIRFVAGPRPSAAPSTPASASTSPPPSPST